VLDGFIRGGATGTDFDDVVTGLGRLPSSRSVALAVGQTMPSLHGNAPATLMHLARSTGVVIQQQLQAVPLTSLLERYLAVGGRAGGTNPPGQRLWVKTLGNRVKQDAVDGASGYRLATDGLMVGTQTDLNKNITLGLARVQRLLQRIEHEVCSHRTAHAPTHDAPGVHVDHESHVQPPCQVET
jgi:hypothetical protein